MVIFIILLDLRYKKSLWLTVKHSESEKPKAILFIKLNQGSEVVLDSGGHFQTLILNGPHVTRPEKVVREEANPIGIVVKL